MKKFITIALCIMLTACGGGGGGGTSINTPTVQTASYIVASSDITSNVYPSTYTTAVTAPVINDTCIITSASIQAPQSYLGSHPLPSIPAGSTLKGIAKLSISPKDNWADPKGLSNPNINAGCATDNRTAYLETLKRLNKLGTSYITIYDSFRVNDFSNPTALVTKFYPDVDLIWMGQQAAVYGIKIRYAVQFAPDDALNRNVDAYLATLTQAQVSTWLIKVFGLYHNFMVNEATVFAQHSQYFDAIKINWGYWQIANWSPYNTIRFNSLTTLSNDIRTVFPTGKQIVDNYTVGDVGANVDNLVPEAIQLVNNIDMVAVGEIATRQLTSLEETNLDVATIKSVYGTYVYNWVTTINKPIIWDIQIQSHSKFFTQGWVEDAGCWVGVCASSITTDFSVQAIGIEALLEIIQNNTTTIQTDSVNINNYWWTDTIMPHDSYPNMSQSIRNKPAEAIVYQWWK